jgi:hypothetical protein
MKFTSIYSQEERVVFPKEYHLQIPKDSSCVDLTNTQRLILLMDYLKSLDIEYLAIIKSYEKAVIWLEKIGSKEAVHCIESKFKDLPKVKASNHLAKEILRWRLRYGI